MVRIANYISILRIILGIALIFMKPLSISFFSVYLLCGISDILDGYIARKTKSISKLGGKLDSIGDFIVIFSTITVLYPIIDLEEEVIILILIIFIIKLISIIIGFYKFKELVMPHTYANKFTGFILFLYPMIFRIIELNYILCIIALISSIEEGLINLKSKKVEVDIKSLFHLKLQNQDVRFINREVIMFYNAKNGSLEIGNTDMNYISFGKGGKVLIMIPGVGDGLKTVKGMAKPFSLMYREFAKEYTVYVFSRKNSLEEGYSIRDMAKDMVFAMKTLGIDKASIIGVSQGGMIAQYMAIDYPEFIEKLVLVVTLGRQNEIIKSAVEGWIEKAKENNYKDIMIDFSERSYSEKSIKKYRRLYPIMTRIGKPKEFTRFIIQATSCITHDTYDELNKIKAETLIIGGDKDRVVGGHTSKELADKIPNCEVKIYEGLGHSAYEEAKDFKDVVLEFLKR